MLIPSSVELRFVSESDQIKVTLSCPAGQASVIPFWGPFMHAEPIPFGPKPEPIKLAYPEPLAHLDQTTLSDQPFRPNVWRLWLQYDSPGPVHYHGVRGDGLRPPRANEVPRVRYLAYGTSITEGFAASHDHFAYPSIVSRRLGFDCLNFGSAGSAHCERELADYFASRVDWDVATVALSSNMMNTGFPIEEFKQRAAYMIRALADARPESPIFAVTIYRRFWDVDPAVEVESRRGSPDDFRAAYCEVITELNRENVFLLDGTDLLTDIGGTRLISSIPPISG